MAYSIGHKARTRQRILEAANRLFAAKGYEGTSIDEIMRAKPASSKGRYLKKVIIATTTGPGIPVDPAITRNFAEA